MPSTKIDNAEALFRKLERTFHRRPAYGEEQLDWVFDTSITAWHIVDWVAQETGQAVGAVQTMMKAKCPELVVCEQLANGAKHLVLSNKKLQPFDVATDVRTTPNRSGMSQLARPGDGPMNIKLTPSVEIQDREGTTWDALGLFWAVIRFWASELKLEFRSV